MRETAIGVKLPFKSLWMIPKEWRKLSALRVPSSKYAMIGSSNPTGSYWKIDVMLPPSHNSIPIYDMVVAVDVVAVVVVGGCCGCCSAHQWVWLSTKRKKAIVREASRGRVRGGVRGWVKEWKTLLTYSSFSRRWALRSETMFGCLLHLFRISTSMSNSSRLFISSKGEIFNATVFPVSLCWAFFFFLVVARRTWDEMRWSWSCTVYGLQSTVGRKKRRKNTTLTLKTLPKAPEAISSTMV